jgi:hypothetical protein
VSVAAAGVPVSEYIMSGIAQDALYVLYLSAADAAVPAPNVKVRSACSGVAAHDAPLAAA